MEEDDPFAVRSPPKSEPESITVGPCTTCDKLLTAVHRIFDMSTQKRYYGVEFEKSVNGLVPAGEIGSTVNILMDQNCTKHQGFMRNFLRLRNSEQENWRFDKGSQVKVYWDVAKDRAILSEESTLTTRYRRQETLLLDYGPRLSVPPCIGQPRDEDFISIDLVRQWISSCEKGHKTSCCVPISPSLPLSWLIDTTALCLVPAEHDTQYVALSYVWGQTEMLKTTQKTLRSLQKVGALSATSRLRVPPVIRHAILLASQLGKRYLWVDSLCIMQDDRESLDHHIRHMASIFEAASLTIVAADGRNAEHGILGIKGVSDSRRLPCPVLRLSERFGLRSRGEQNILASPWGSRGWTFQEHIFSKRKLVFVHGSAQWICQESRCFEDIRQRGVSNRKNRRRDYVLKQELESVGELALKFPMISEIEHILCLYTTRNLTFGDDVIRAVEAIFTAYSEAFPGGFFLGLPVDFFDMALLWFHYSDIDCWAKRRAAVSPGTEPPFPSWTWAGWNGRVTQGTWRAATYIQDADDPPWAGKKCSTIPMLEWQYFSESDGSERPIPGLNNAYAYKLKFMGKKDALPLGWKYEREPPRTIPKVNMRGAETAQDDSIADDTTQDGTMEEDMMEDGRKASVTMPRYYYTHGSAPGIKFWHPVPISVNTQGNATTLPDGRILCARTQGCHLWATLSRYRRSLENNATSESGSEDEVPLSEAPYIDAILVDIEGEPVGELRISEEDDIDGVKRHEIRPDEAGYPCELVAISKGSDCVYPMEPEKEMFTFYNVLWVKWEDGIAYRRGVGRVDRKKWESMQLEDIDLRLG